MLVGYYYGTNDMAITILSSPIWLVASLLSTGISYGTAVSFAQFMASNNKRAASNILSQSFSVISLAAFLFALVSWLFSPILTPLLGVNADMYTHAVEYNRYLSIALGFSMITKYLYYMVNTDSSPTLALMGNVVKAVLYAALSMFFMGVMDCGMIGSAYALLIAEIVGALIMSSHFFFKTTIIKLRLSLPNKENIKRIFATTDNISAVVAMLVLNNLLMNNFSIEIVAIYLMIISFNDIILSIIASTSYAMMPLMSTFFGERNGRGIKETFSIGIKNGLVISGIIVLILVVFAPWIPGLYGYKHPEYMPMAINAIFLYAISVPFCMLLNIAINTFISISKYNVGFYLGIFNTLIIPVVLGVIAIFSHSPELVWLLYFISSIIPLLVSVAISLFLKRYSIENYLSFKDKNQVLKANFCILLRPDDIGSLEEYQEMTELFLMAQEVEDIKVIRSKIIVGEIMEYALQTHQRKGGYVDIQLGVHHNGTVRIMVKLDNDTIHITNDAILDENLISLGILRNASKDFKYNRILSFNTFDMIV